MIIKEELIKLLSAKKIKDYTYTVIFFFTVSFFTFVVIKPNIITVFTLRKEIEELQRIDLSYTNVIDKIVNLQSSIEKTRDTIGVLDEAFPTTPQINQLVEDIKKTSSESGVVIGRMVVSEINLKNRSKDSGYNKIKIDLTVKSGFEESYNFILELFEQRRLKSINNIVFSRESNEGTGSATVNIKLLVEGYYL